MWISQPGRERSLQKTKSGSNAARKALPSPPILWKPPPANRIQPDCAHPKEKEFAQILDFYSLRWKYAHCSFPLRWDDRMTEMLTPDFFGLYVKLTTMKQRLVTENKP